MKKEITALNVLKECTKGHKEEVDFSSHVLMNTIENAYLFEKKYNKAIEILGKKVMSCPTDDYDCIHDERLRGRKCKDCWREYIDGKYKKVL